MSQLFVSTFFPHFASLVRDYLPYVYHATLSSCPTPYLLVSVGSIKIITNPALGCVCMLGIGLGLFLGLLILSQPHGLRDASRLHFTFSFFFYATMCFSALGYHCCMSPIPYIESTGLLTSTVYHNLPFFTTVFHWIDTCATCCSSIAFPIGLLYEVAPKSIISKTSHIFVSLYVVIFVSGWTFRDTSWFGELLYIGGVHVGVISTILIFYIYKFLVHKTPVKYLVCGLLSLVLGFLTPLLELSLCAYLGPHLTGPVWVFLGCHLSFIWLYFWIVNLGSNNSKLGGKEL
jgi:hypothetical protein